MQLVEAMERIGKGSAWVLLGKGSFKIFFLLAQLIIARALGAEAFGLVSIGLTALVFLSVFSRLGLDTGIRRYIPEYEKSRKRVSELVSFSAAVVLLVSLFFALVLYFTSGLISQLFSNEGLAPVLKVFAVIIPISALGVLLLRGLEGFLVMKYRFWLEGLLYGMVLVAGVLIASALDGVVAVSAAFLAAHLAVLLAALFVIARHIGQVAWPGLKKGKELMLYSWPLTFHSSLELGIRYLNILILGILSTESAAGIYSAAINLGIIFLLFIVITTPAFFPLVSKMRSQGKDTSNIYKSLTKFLLLATAPALAVGMIFSKELMHYAFGAEFAKGGMVLAIILVAFLAEVMAGPVEMYLNAFDQTRLVMLNMLVAVVVAVGLAFVLIPVMGVLGAALAFTLAVVLQKILGAVEIYALRKVHPIKKGYLGILGLALVLGVLLYIGKQQLEGLAAFGAIVALGLALYAFLSFKLLLDEEDKKVILKLKEAVRI